MTTAVIEWNGRALTVAEWARELGADYETLRWRLRNGWSVEEALGTGARAKRKQGEKAPAVKAKRKRHLRVVQAPSEPLCHKLKDKTKPCDVTECRYHLEHSGDTDARRYKGTIEARRAAGVEENCALGLANRGGMDQTEVAHYMGMSPQRVNAIEEMALRKLRRSKAEVIRLAAIEMRGERDE